MIRDLLRWVAPGIVTVVGGTAAALAMTTPGMMTELAGQGRQILRDDGMVWAYVDVSGRQAHLTGTTDTTASRDEAIRQLASLSGLESVTSDVLLAPIDRPYRLNVSIEDGAITLSGSVPNPDHLYQLKSYPGLITSNLSIRSGQPDEARWFEAATYALSQASRLQTGTVTLTDLDLDIFGRARSQAAFGLLDQAIAAPPMGLTLNVVSVEPVLASPYTWTAEYDGQRIAISGNVPDDALIERYRLADLSGLPVATGLALASGAPADFAGTSQALLQQLVRLDTDRATIVDGESRLTGAPPSIEIAQAVTESLSGTGSIVQLSPPRVNDYWVSVTRQEGGVLVFDGYAPDEATRSAFSETPNADVNFLKLGSGAPLAYRSAVDFGLALLNELSEGRFTFSGSTLAISGAAETPEAYRALRNLIDNDLPQGVTISSFDVRAPVAAAYGFTMLKHADGTVTLSGLLPDAAAESAILADIGTGAVSNVDFATGEPAGFLDAAERATDFLPWLQQGQVTFDGTNWIVSGTPASAVDKASIETEYAVRDLATSGWSLDLAEIPAPPAEETPTTSPATEPAAPATAETPAEPEPEPSPAIETAQQPANPEPTPAPAAPANPSPSPDQAAALAYCRERVAELSADNAILFQSGAAIIADSADTELNLFGAALARCPDARVYVEGHTDSDGDDRRNLALSVARAEAVVEALIQRGVAPERLYAVGYGESQPVADNATAEGKRQNRRIVVTVEEDKDD